jgi:hypothetical protein
MASTGRVTGGNFLNATVTTAAFGSDLVVQTGLKGRKLNEEHVAEWREVAANTPPSALSAVGQAVTSVVLPRALGKGASAAVGAALDTSKRPSHVVLVDWADGKQSLIKLPESLFTHLEVALRSRRVQDASATSEGAASDAKPTEGPGTVTEQAFALASSFLKDRVGPAKPAAIVDPGADIADQLAKLGSLRDSGVLTEEEFAAKKAELLSRI